MTQLANPEHRERWRAQAIAIAGELKQLSEFKNPMVKFAIALDDYMITLGRVVQPAGGGDSLLERRGAG